MKDFLTAYGERLERNSAALLKLATDVMAADPTVEVYCHRDDKHKKGLVFFKGEEINKIHFHEVPYHWSGCGYAEHFGGENLAMPFTVEDVLQTFKPVTTVMDRHDTFFKSKAEYLKWCSYLQKVN